MLKFIVISYSLSTIYITRFVGGFIQQYYERLWIGTQLPINQFMDDEEDRRSKLERRKSELHWQRNQIVFYASLNTSFVLLGVVLDVFFTGWMYVVPIMSIQFAFKSLNN